MRRPRDFPSPELAFAFVSELVVMDHRDGTVSLVAAVLIDGDRSDARRIAVGRRAGTARCAAGGARRPRRARGSPQIDLTTSPAAPPPLDAGGLPRRGGDVEDVHPRRRRVPGGGLPALRSRPHGDAARRLPRAARPQPLAVHVRAHARRPLRASPTRSSARRPRRSSRSQTARVFSHPIAGSRPRGANPGGRRRPRRGAARRRKEQAEHLMLVDLARNDLLEGVPPGLGRGHRVHAGRAVQPHHAPRLERRGRRAARRDAHRCLPRDVPRRNAERRPQAARPRDHRRARARPSRRLRGSGRLLRRSPATSISRSPSAPPTSPTGSPACRRGRDSSRTPTRQPSTRVA